MANFVNIPELMAPTDFEDRLGRGVETLNKLAKETDDRNRERVEEKAAKLAEIHGAFIDMLPVDGLLLNPALVKDVNPICGIYVQFSVLLRNESYKENTEGARGAVVLAKDYLRGTGMPSIAI